MLKDGELIGEEMVVSFVFRLKCFEVMCNVVEKLVNCDWFGCDVFLCGVFEFILVECCFVFEVSFYDFLIVYVVL